MDSDPRTVSRSSGGIVVSDASAHVGVGFERVRNLASLLYEIDRMGEVSIRSFPFFIFLPDM